MSRTLLVPRALLEDPALAALLYAALVEPSGGPVRGPGEIQGGR